MSKKEEGKLTFKEKIQLKLHLSICDFCTRFQKQVRLFTNNASHSQEHIHIKMSDGRKETIKELLKD